MEEKCFCHLNGYAVKDAKARNKLVLNDHFYYYIDGVNGSDENNGLTEATAFKTANKLLSLCNENNFDVRGCFISPGEYNIEANLFVCNAWHMKATVDGVVLNFTDPANVGEIVFYGTHYNFNNMKLKTANEFRFETCAVGLTDVVFECGLYVNFMGCYIDSATNLTVPKLLLYGTTGRIRNLVSTHKGNDDANLVVQRGSNIRFYGTMTFTNTDVMTKTYLMTAINSVVWFELESLSCSNYTYGVKIGPSVLHLPKNIYNDIASGATNPVVESSFGSLIINDTLITGGSYT